MVFFISLIQMGKTDGILQPSETARWFNLQPTVGEEKRPQKLLREWISARITVAPYVSTMRSLALQHLWHCQHIASFTFLKMREKEESNVANEWYRSLEESCQLSKSLFMSEMILDDRMYVLFFFLSSWECSKCEAEWINDRKIHQICSRCLRVASVWFVKCVI